MIAPSNAPPRTKASVNGNTVRKNRLMTSVGVLERCVVVDALAMILPFRNSPRRHREHRGCTKHRPLVPKLLFGNAGPTNPSFPNSCLGTRLYHFSSLCDFSLCPLCLCGSFSSLSRRGLR